LCQLEKKFYLSTRICLGEAVQQPLARGEFSDVLCCADVSAAIRVRCTQVAALEDFQIETEAQRAGREPGEGEDPPPPFRSWKALYALVLGELAILIAAFTLFTRHFR